MKRIVRGITSTVSVIITSLLIASGAQAATSEQKDIADSLSSTRNAAHQDSLIFSAEMASRAQAWAEHLAAVDGGGKPPGDPNLYQPPGTMTAISTTAQFSRNDIKSVEAKLETDQASIVNDPAYNTVGTGFAVAKSGAIYLVADFAGVKAPKALSAPAPAPVQAPVEIPAPAVVQQPAPVQELPMEQTPVQVNPAPAPAPVEAAPAPAAPAPAPVEAPKPAVTPSPTATPTPTPSGTSTASASPSAITTTSDAQTMDTMRTSDNTRQVLGMQPQQGLTLAGISGLVLAGGGGLSFANRKSKALAI